MNYKVVNFLFPLQNKNWLFLENAFIATSIRKNFLVNFSLRQKKSDILADLNVQNRTDYMCTCILNNNSLKFTLTYENI